MATDIQSKDCASDLRTSDFPKSPDKQPFSMVAERICSSVVFTCYAVALERLLEIVCYNCGATSDQVKPL